MDFHRPINPSNLFSANGLVVAITGGGSGIGLEIAAALHQNGAKRIYLLGRRREVLDSAVKTLTSSPAAPPAASDDVATIVPVPCDITSPDSIKAAVAKVETTDGFVDVLVNSAGVIGPKHSDFYEQDSVEGLRDVMLRDWNLWETTMATNTSSVIGVSAAFLPLLEAANRRRGWEAGKLTRARTQTLPEKEGDPQAKVDEDDQRLAHIITIASVGSFMRKLTAGLAYNASKAAAAHLGKMMATMFAEWGIRSNVVAPGPYPSDMTTKMARAFPPNELPAGRMGNELDIASLILFLVGKGGAYINGTVQVTDGGRLGVFPSTY
ncbi:NAD(P)-binding protein [Mytilinidion resinicola]|uniref:NAD(P)-binding protein n=1 Tax=Mytilinidion resinicola TaxID=574789 RepID=A0A6A6Y9G4_9PEZI|nr:NAD(P)-binding protein [Mytilinidion resinicola]KAF2804765.1 NAD(P)-binding protein [Mytilinidion resinicola]